MGIFDHILNGKKPTDPNPSDKSAPLALGIAPRRFLPPESILPRAVLLPPPVDPSVLPFADGELIFPLSDMQDRIPAHLVRPGIVLAENVVRYRISELYTQIMRGQVSISLLSINQKSPELFRSAIAPSDDIEIPLPLELVVGQLPSFPDPHARAVAENGLRSPSPVEPPESIVEVPFNPTAPPPETEVAPAPIEPDFATPAESPEMAPAPLNEAPPPEPMAESPVRPPAPPPETEVAPAPIEPDFATPVESPEMAPAPLNEAPPPEPMAENPVVPPAPPPGSEVAPAPIKPDFATPAESPEMAADSPAQVPEAAPEPVAERSAIPIEDGPEPEASSLHIAPSPALHLVETPPLQRSVLAENAPQRLGPESGPELPFGAMLSPFDQERLQQIFGRNEVFDALAVAQAIRNDGPALAVFLLIEEEEFLNGHVPDDLTSGWTLQIRRSLEQMHGDPLPTVRAITLPAGSRFRTVWARGQVALAVVHDNVQPSEQLARLATASVDSLAEHH